MAEENKVSTRTSWTVNGQVLVATFPDGEALTLDTKDIDNDEVRDMCFFYGVKQKVADSGAGQDTWENKRTKMQDTFDMLASGKWTDKKFRRTNEEIIADKITSAMDKDSVSAKEAEQLKKLLAKAGMNINLG